MHLFFTIKHKATLIFLKEKAKINSLFLAFFETSFANILKTSSICYPPHKTALKMHFWVEKVAKA
jgi:hypothetical protein